jgi:ankyrin repeat protein
MAHEIFHAIETGDAARARELADAASERNEEGVPARLFALYYGQDDLAQELRRHGGELDVFEAAAFGDGERLRELLDVDPSLVNAFAPDGFYPLGLAAFFKHPDAVRLLLERGADANQQSRHAQIVVRPIHAAAANGGSVEICRMLLDAGADVNAEQPGGFRPLDAALQERNAELEALLRERGAQPGSGAAVEG